MPSRKNWVTLTPEQELERGIPKRQAAAMNNISKDTWDRQYGHLNERISPRRCIVRLKNAINPTPPKAA